ncbi:MAG TPA: MFS transporter [Micropepsaceae bacterium]|nr:MFS transporter [Micropepsaceae bacterium]
MRRAFAGSGSAGFLPLLCALYLLLYLDRVNIATAAPLIQNELHLGHAGLGVVLSAFAYSYAFCQLIGGLAGERFGPRRMLCASVILVCLATAATGLSPGIAALIAARIALGFGEGAALPTATQAMAKQLPRSNWGFAQGVTHAFARLGNFATPPIVAALILVSSWRVAFLLLATIGLVWIAAWLFWFHEPSAPPGNARKAEVASFSQWVTIAKRTAPATAVNFCYGWTLWLFLTWIPSFFVQNYHLSLTGSALYSAGVFLGGLIGDALGGWASDRMLRRSGNPGFARRSVIVTGFLGSCACLLAVMFSTDPRMAAIMLSLAFLFAELIVAPIWAVTMDIVPAHPGLASGIMNFGSAFAGIVSPLAFGLMVDATGSWTIPFGISVGLLLLGAGLTLALHPQERAPAVWESQLEATNRAGGGAA